MNGKIYTLKIFVGLNPVSLQVIWSRFNCYQIYILRTLKIAKKAGTFLHDLSEFKDPGQRFLLISD